MEAGTQRAVEREVLDAVQIATLARGELLPAPQPPSDDSQQPAAEPIEDAADDESAAKKPHGLPQPGNQPA